MKVNYLFTNRFKKIGWFILIPSMILGLIHLIYDFEPAFLDFSLPAIFIDDLGLSNGNRLFGIVNNNIFNEIIGIAIIISSLFVAFSKEKLEDEYISKIRLESLVWAIYVNYGILLVSFLFIYDFTFLNVMVFNMFTVLIFFIIRFNWQISNLGKSSQYEE